MKQDHILIIRFSALGDVAMTVPVIYSLAKKYPDLRITVLSKPMHGPMFENISPNVGFMGADTKKEYSGIKGLNKLYRRLVAKNFTAIADFHSVLRSEYLRMRFNIDNYRVEHVNKQRSKKKLLTSIENKKIIKLKTAFEVYADVLAKLGYPVELGDFNNIFGSETPDISHFPTPLNKKADGEKWIGIAPFAGHKGKIYPLNKMEKVIDILIGKFHDSKIMLFGRGEKEVAVINKWCNKHRQCVYASGSLKNLGEELALMSHLDVMISMDSGNMHLASLVEVPVVSIWGATHPYAGFLGWKQAESNIMQLDLPCRPCSIYGKKKCYRGDYQCLNIPPEEIAERVEFNIFRS